MTERPEAGYLWDRLAEAFDDLPKGKAFGLTSLRGAVVARAHRVVAGLMADLEAKRVAAESSRRDWAAEAMRLQHFIDTALFPDLQPDFHTVRMALPPVIPTVCACVTDEQADQLTAAGFSRPVCAVHPTGEASA